MHSFTITSHARRNWRERLFSWPWRPWVSTKPVEYKVEVRATPKEARKPATPQGPQFVDRAHRTPFKAAPITSTPSEAARRLDSDDTPYQYDPTPMIMAIASALDSTPSDDTPITSGGGGDFGGGGATASWDSGSDSTTSTD